jgi:putative two-component system response regulator
MRTHTVIGRDILAGSPAPLLQTAETIAYAHHERWDGRGYHGLEGEATPIEARIVTVADTWDALVNDRPYRTARTFDYAVHEMRGGRARQFDPRVLDTFLDLLARGTIPSPPATTGTTN